MTVKTFKQKRLEQLEAQRARRSVAVDQADGLSDQQLINVLVNGTPELQARARALGRPLKPSDVTDADLLKIIEEGDL